MKFCGPGSFLYIRTPFNFLMEELFMRMRIIAHCCVLSGLSDNDKQSARLLTEGILFLVSLAYYISFL